MPVSKRSTRLALSRERILRAAMRLADTEGLANLTMRRLADDLGVRAVSIYRHVPDKAALMTGLVEMMLSEIRHPGSAGDWKSDMRVVMQSFRAAFRSHPEIAEVSHLYTSAEVLYPHYEQDLQSLVDGGFSLPEAKLAFGALRSFTAGFARGAAERSLSPPSAEVFPITAAAGVGGERADQTVFEYGLDCLIAGIELRRQGG